MFFTINNSMPNESIGRPAEVHYNPIKNDAGIPNPNMTPASDNRIDEILSVYKRFDAKLRDAYPYDTETITKIATRLTDSYFKAKY